MQNTSVTRQFLLLIVCISLVSACGLPFAAAQSPVQTIRNVPYNPSEGNSPATSLDIYRPAGEASYPVVIWVHGGGWILGDKRIVNRKPKAFTDQKFVLVSINYRMHPRVNFRGMASDVATAVRWVKDNIQAYGGNPRRLFLMGHSSGAHLCALIGTDATYLTSQGLVTQDLSGIILLDGPAYDVPQEMRSSNSTLKTIYTKIFSADPDVQRAGSPTLHAATAAGIPPCLIIHCTDRETTIEQSVGLAQAIRDAGGDAYLVPVSDKSHSNLNRNLGIPGDQATEQVFAFLNGYSEQFRD